MLGVAATLLDARFHQKRMTSAAAGWFQWLCPIRGVGWGRPGTCHPLDIPCFWCVWYDFWRQCEKIKWKFRIKLVKREGTKFFCSPLANLTLRPCVRWWFRPRRTRSQRTPARRQYMSIWYKWQPDIRFHIPDAGYPANNTINIFREPLPRQYTSIWYKWQPDIRFHIPDIRFHIYRISGK